MLRTARMGYVTPDLTHVFTDVSVTAHCTPLPPHSHANRHPHLTPYTVTGERARGRWIQASEKRLLRSGEEEFHCAAAPTA